LLCRKSADFIIGTNVGLRELTGQGIVAYGHSGGTLPLYGWRALGAIGHLASRHRQRVRPNAGGTANQVHRLTNLKSSAPPNFRDGQILSAAVYKELRSDVSPALDMARDRLAALVDDPGAIQDTSTIALAALALEPETSNNPLEVKV
jgi:hypothetical protein